MQFDKRRIGVLAAVIVVAVAGFVIASSSSDDKSKSTTTGPVTIVVKHGKPVGGIKPIKVNKGDRVQFTVKSDVSDEIHVHGYDFHKDVKAGGQVSFDFPAKDDGAFEIELESRKQQIAALTVQP